MKREVRLKIDTSMPEKLIGQALSLGAEFASVRRSGSRSIIADCGERSADILTGLCKRYHLNCRILRSAGRNALYQKLRGRITLPAGILLCLFICSFVLSRVWLIDISFTGPSAQLGNEKELRAILNEMQIRPGMKTSAADTDLLQKRLFADAGNYSHIGVRIHGIRLLVEAAPEVPSPEIYDLANARDLVAAMDGVVKSVNVRSGSACVSPGELVQKGQLLIRGEEEKSKEETAAVGALGEVHIRSWFEGRASGDLKEKKILRTGRKSVSTRIRLMHWSFPLTEGERFDQYESETEILPIIGLFLPLEIMRETHFETEAVTADADQAILLPRLRSLAQAEARSNLSQNGPAAYEITDYWEESTTTDNTLHLRAVYEIAADIAVTRDALIANKEDN